VTKTKRSCPECGEEFWNVPAHMAARHGAARPERSVARHAKVPEPGPEPAEAPEPELPPAAPSEEIAPRKPGLRERLRSRRNKGRPGAQTPVPGERPPKRKRPSGRRVALDQDISDVWAFGGRRLMHGPHFATGRMLQYQAPAAGVIVDRAVAGTLADRIVFQPIARNRDKYEDVAFLLAGPLLTFSITMTMQQMQQAIDEGDKDAYDSLAAKLEMQREMFTWVLSMMLPRLAEGAKLARQKKAETDAVIADAFPELGDEDPVDVLATSLFTPPTYETAATNGRHANGEPDPAAADPRQQGSVPFGV
jgi:hypothetical protein